MGKKYSTLEKVFSVKKTEDKKHKVVTLMGIQAKFRHFDYKPFITVIVPNYNHAPYLQERLDSIYNQTYKKFEVILLDDCSTDNSVEILKKYQSKHKKNTTLIVNDKNLGGVFYQWKKGIELAKGELIWIAESDDWCNKNFLAELINYFKDEAIMIAYGKSLFIHNGKEVGNINKYLKSLKYDFDKPFVENTYNIINNGFGYFNMIPNASSAVLRNTGFKSILNNAAWYKMKLCGDWMFYLELIKGGKIAYNPKAVNYYRRHDENISKQIRNSDNYFREHNLIAEYINSNFKADNKIYKKLFKQLAKFLKKDYCPIKTEEELKKIYSPDNFGLNKKRKLNILVVQYKDSEEIANHLKSFGHCVTYYISDKNQTKRPKILNKAIPCIYSKDISIKNALKNFGIDIVYKDDYEQT